MINKNHNIEIFVDNKRIDLFTQNNINLRINNKLYDPTTITSKQAEYSYSFNIPATQNNNKILNYANNLSTLNKFNNNYKAEVYADNELIFNGTFRVTSYENNEYNCNIISVKLNTLQDIFKETKLNDIEWYIPFDGTPTITSYNTRDNLDVIFPLVSYGAFQKKRKATLANYNQYTSKFDIDEYNRWYMESFPPSLSLMETVKRCFQQQGYTVSGDIFDDEKVKRIYMSTYLADGQDPEYNVGNPLFGKVKLKAYFSNYYNNVPTNPASTSGGFRPGTQNPLTYPYQKLNNSGLFQFESAQLYNLLDGRMRGRGDTPQEDVIIEGDTYMYDKGEKVIVIPADGLYKITFKARTVFGAYRNYQMTNVAETRVNGANEPYDVGVTFKCNMRTNCPIEFQVVRNHEYDNELIKGPRNYRYPSGDTTQAPITWDTMYPHEDLYGAVNPTKTVDGTKVTTTTRRTYSSTDTLTRSTTTDITTRATTTRPSTGRPSTGGLRPGYVRPPAGDGDKGYMPKGGEMIAYDPVVNPNFICGLTTMGDGAPAVIKNGYSWNPLSPDRYEALYNCTGYYNVNADGWTQTEFNKNEYPIAPTDAVNINANGTSMAGTVHCMVYLNKNDVISLIALSRTYEELGASDRRRTITACYDVETEFSIEAFAPYGVDIAKRDNINYNSPVVFNKDLRLSNFLNRETKMYDFVNNFIKEFNLSFEQNGTHVILNKQLINLNENKYSINIDDRINTNDIKSSKIEYPASLEVKYKINTNTWGFEKTVPQDKINLTNWAEYGDYGSDKIILDDSGENKDETIQLNNSYTYYDNFYIINPNEPTRQINIPVISEIKYMIDGYDYDESMAHDGKGLQLSYWYKGSESVDLKLTNGETVSVVLPVNKLSGVNMNLSYKITENSILNNYFNINPTLSSNLIEVNVYINPIEYKLIKSGVNINVDDDIYIVNEVQGYDPTGNNKTKLILMKKV